MLDQEFRDDTPQTWAEWDAQTARIAKALGVAPKDVPISEACASRLGTRKTDR